MGFVIAGLVVLMVVLVVKTLNKIDAEEAQVEMEIESEEHARLIRKYSRK